MADARWVFHLDMEALAQTDFYRGLVRNGQAKAIFNLAIQAAGEEFKMDFARCESLTFFGGMDDDEDAWAGLLRMPSAYRQEVLAALEKLAAKEDVPLEKVEENPAWHGFSYDDEIYIYSPLRDVFLLGEETATDDAVEIVAGKAANQPSPLVQGWERKPGVFLAMAGQRETDSDSPFPEGFELDAAPYVSLAKMLPALTQAITNAAFGAIEKETLFMGETNHQFWMAIDLKATNAASALQLRQTLTNLAALAQTLTATNRQWHSLASQLKITLAKETVHLTLTHPTQWDNRSLYEGWITLPATPSRATGAPPAVAPAATPKTNPAAAPGNKKGAP